MSRDRHNYSSPLSAGRLFSRVVLLAAAGVIIWYLS